MAGPIARLLMRGAIAGLTFTNIQSVTNVPWGTTDDTQVGGPPDKYGWTGFIGGPGMCITEEGHRNWPEFRPRSAPAAHCPANAPRRHGQP